jgi:hypothetical protein
MTLNEIKQAIEKLTTHQTLELAEWLDEHCLALASSPGTKAPDFDESSED